MRAKQLIEKLEDLATFFTLVASNADKRRKESKTIMSAESLAFWEGKEQAYKTAFNKIDGILKEAKR